MGTGFNHGQILVRPGKESAKSGSPKNSMVRGLGKENFDRINWMIRILSG
jgi:hypothetical protein